MTVLQRSQSSRRQAAPHRSRPSTYGSSKRWRWKLGLTVCAVVGLLCLLAVGFVTRLLAPASNTELTRFDAIVVLGAPVDMDGNPTPEQLARVTEGVREYERGVAPRLILTGGPTRNLPAEALVMARAAQAQGIPASAIFVEPAARDTIHNACYSARIMKAHGWRTAEVVSSAYHLPRAGLIFNRLPLEWRTHAAPPLSPDSAIYADAITVGETLRAARYLLWASWAESCEP